MATPATDHFHHYTYGDTDEPEVSEQLKPLYDHIHDLYNKAAELRRDVTLLENRSSEPVDGSVEPTATAEAPERYVRINVTKNSKGYTHETTVSVRGSLSEQEARFEVSRLLEMADLEARLEIANREQRDHEESEARS
jgi:hypothetical protein